jgi:cyclohexanone monooxygenase
MSTASSTPAPSPNAAQHESYDAVVVGAGFAGMYMLYKLQQRGLKVRLYEAGSGVGGTWYWNRYPGARVDVESVEYSYSFDDELQQEWSWTERYASQPELLRYCNHVADRFKLRPNMQFDTKVTAAHYDDNTARWNIRTSRGDRVSAKYCVLATGFLSAGSVPDFVGLNDYQGNKYLTSRWPKEEIDFTGQRVIVIGTGSSAVQSIPIIAQQAKHLTVFQRTPSFSIPARNGPLDRAYEARVKAMYGEWRRRQREESRGGFIALNFEPAAPNNKSAMECTAAERLADYETRWKNGGLAYYSSYIDLLTNKASNDTLAEFVRGKIRERVKDPHTAELLCPTTYPILAKRLCADTNYYETYNRDNVTLVSIKDTPIEKLTNKGLVVAGKEYEADSIIFATGFDAVTGAIKNIEVRGLGGKNINDHWLGAPRAYLGLMSAGFPNLFFLDGPCSNGALVSPMLLSEYQVEWVDRLIGTVGIEPSARIDAKLNAEEAWMTHMDEVGKGSLLYEANSWYLGANIPGKPRALLSYLGGLEAYRQQCRAGEANGYGNFSIVR